MEHLVFDFDYIVELALEELDIVLVELVLEDYKADLEEIDIVLEDYIQAFVQVLQLPLQLRLLMVAQHRYTTGGLMEYMLETTATLLQAAP